MLQVILETLRIEQVKSVLRALETEELGTRKLMDALGLKHRPNFIYNYLHPALTSGKIEMTQPNSPTSPTQKYRLNEKGRATLENQ